MPVLISLVSGLFQESLISAWLQFSDGSTTPLDNYDPAHFTLTATSLEERVVQVRRSARWKWPTVVAKGEGQGLLVRVEVRPSGACPPETPGGVLAAGTANVQVRLQVGRRRPPDPPYLSGSVSEPDTTIKEKIKAIPDGKPREAGGLPKDPNMGQTPRSRSSEDRAASGGGLSHLEMGLYPLLGVLCLALLLLLINCVSYAHKQRSEQRTLENPGMRSHAHEWVWLGQEGQHQELSGSLEEGCQLFNGAVTRANQGSSGKVESLNSPTSRRKRVEFTTFSNGCPGLSPVALVPTCDVKPACWDTELGDSKQPRK